MNFKPTLWKIIFSFLILIASDLILSYLSTLVFCATYPGMEFAKCPTFIDYIINPGFLFVSFFLAILIYIIWSLFQKK